MTTRMTERPMRAPSACSPEPEYAPTILCIDDDPEISRLIEIRLREYDVRVLRSFHGMQGYWLALYEKPDLILTDLNMPQGDGQYVLECLQRNVDTRGIPVIVLTGQYRGGATQRRLMELGAAGFLTKPLPMNLLLSEIRRYVKLKRQPGERA